MWENVLVSWQNRKYANLCYFEAHKELCCQLAYGKQIFDIIYSMIYGLYYTIKKCNIVLCVTSQWPQNSQRCSQNFLSGKHESLLDSVTFYLSIWRDWVWDRFSPLTKIPWPGYSQLLFSFQNLAEIFFSYSVIASLKFQCP